MRLSKIKLAGFKSFVDPTTIPLPGNLVGVVGPNGCGKSNVIDAIRWVMGETSAKHLRGDSMEDVIFNGSSARKPVGTASVELFFDNSDGAIGGQYASYAEISIRRVVSRDGVSQYFLNNTRCRRKDITGLFLGTGLGPRSYAIIEQGMVSRLVEARPEEMRTYIEEAAGISKYKERRRETENRMSHTRENLARLNDLRDEIEKQLKHLQRQAQVAEKYKTLKQDERQLEAQLLAIRLAGIDEALAGTRAGLSARQTEHEAALAGQREVEAAIEAARARHVDASEAHSKAQAAFYGVQGEISRLEQALQHARELKTRQQGDRAEAEAQLSAVAAEIDADAERLQTLEADVAAFEPRLEEATAAERASAATLDQSQQALDAWQARWHDFNLEIREQEQIREVEQTRLEHLKAHRERLERQLENVEGERRSISVVELEAGLAAREKLEQAAAEALQAATAGLESLTERVGERRDAEQRLGADTEQLRGELESRRGRLETLRTVQRAALTGEAGQLDDWLGRHGLNGDTRLVSELEVDGAWSRAVEVVLGEFLEAVLVDDASGLARAGLPDTRLALLDRAAGNPGNGAGKRPGTLAEQVRRAGALESLLATVHCVPSVDEAGTRLRELASHESVITPDGIWLGHGWVRVARGDRYSGAIGREHEIRELSTAVGEYESRLEALSGRRQEARAEIDALERQRADGQARLGELGREAHQAAAVMAGLRRDLERARERLAVLGNDSASVQQELATLAGRIEEAEARLAGAVQALAALAERRTALKAEQEGLLADFSRARETAGADREHFASLRVELESRRAAREAARGALQRVRAQHEQLVQRIAQLGEQIAEAEAPMADLQASLDADLGRQAEVQNELRERREELEAVEHAVRSDETRRAELHREVNALREQVDALRMQVRELEVRRESFAERFAATTLVLEEVIATLPAEAVPEEWDQRLGQLRQKIERLGPINLAAIDEFAEQSERKNYLDSQHADLSSALETLEQAIRKIDRETRTRFQETFDSINDGLKRLFPRLFGGGHAYLTLEGDDLLTAGVTVMARPPGKRNSHIHLLSGGEKALTAVALIFSIFELNPAPFCLLDEVDAPLDEANVGRFCDIVREMSATVQFLVITHNKTTMEMANQLTGVTMNEPGVSRLVAVDIDEAVRLVAS